MTDLTLSSMLVVMRDTAMVHSAWVWETFPTSTRTKVWECRCGAFLTDTWPGLPAIDALLAAHQLTMMEQEVRARVTATAEPLPTPDHHGDGPPLDQVTPELITTLARLFDLYGPLGVVRVAQKMQADGIDSGADAEQYLESLDPLGPMVAVLRILLA